LIGIVGLRFSFVDTLIAMHPYYIARAFGGLLFFTGACICFWNVVMTIRRVSHHAPAIDYPTTSEAMEPAVPAVE
jgi:cytochrome c oxidase cbb3-type subunit 1